MFPVHFTTKQSTTIYFITFVTDVFDVSENIFFHGIGQACLRSRLGVFIVGREEPESIESDWGIRVWAVCGRRVNKSSSIERDISKKCPFHGSLGFKLDLGFQYSASLSCSHGVSSF